MSHIDRKQRDKERIKASILQAARDIAQKEGWSSVTIRKIAEKIEYTPPIVYEHFENKEDLIQELVYTGFDYLKQKFEEYHAIENDPKKLLMHLALTEWEFAFNQTELFQLMFSLEKPPPNAEMEVQMKTIRKLFLEISNNDEQLADDLILSFFCISHGSIMVLLQFAPPPHLINLDKKSEYIKIMNRYFKSLD